MKHSNRKRNAAVAAIGSALLVSGGLAYAGAQGAALFATADLQGGYLLADKSEAEGKCGEGKCGAETKDSAEGKCGGAAKAAAEGTCGGEAKTGAEGKCGGEAKAATEGKCGSESHEG